MKLPFKSAPKKTRVLLVPNHWSGSVQEYYHFILGYLGPILVWQKSHPSKEIAIRDCGPMQPWIDLLLDPDMVQQQNPGAMLHLVAQGQHPTVFLKGFDNPDYFDRKKLTEFRDIVLNRFSDLGETPSDTTVIDRSVSGEFNHSAAAEIPASGSAVRSTPNLAGAVSAFKSQNNFRLVDSSLLVPLEQLAIFANTRILIGQHGAGLTNMLWMRPGGTVIEILPPLEPWVSPIFERLATTLGHKHVAIPQLGNHSDVDVIALTQAIRNAQGEHSLA